MSVVTNAMLYFSVLSSDDAEQAQLDQVNQFFADECRLYHSRGFVAVNDPSLPDGWYGGTKYLECNLALGAFNHLDLPGLLAHLRSLTWENPEQVQLIVKEQEDDGFRILDVFPEGTAEEGEDG